MITTVTKHKSSSNGNPTQILLYGLEYPVRLPFSHYRARKTILKDLRSKRITQPLPVTYKSNEVKLKICSHSAFSEVSKTS